MHSIKDSLYILYTTQAESGATSNNCDSSIESSADAVQKQLHSTPPKLSRRNRPRSNTAPSLPLTTHNELSSTPQTSPKQERRRRRKTINSLSSPSQKFFSNSPSKNHSSSLPQQKSPQKGKNFVLKFRSADACQSVGLTTSTPSGLTPSAPSRRLLGEDFKQFNDIEKIKRVKVVAERIMKVRDAVTTYSTKLLLFW